MSKDTKALLTSQFNSSQRMGIPWEGSLWPLEEVTGLKEWGQGVALSLL